MERIDDLMVNNLRLIQDDALFCFGHDAVELANFVEGTPADSAADLCSGNGIIAVLLAGKKGIKTTAVEIDKALADLAARNAALNGLQGKMDVLNLPIQRLQGVLKKGGFSIVTCNPPYFEKGSGRPPRDGVAGARHELFVTLGEVIAAADYLLAEKGRLFMVYPVSRLAELICLCAGAGLQPKELVLLSTKNGAKEGTGEGAERTGGGADEKDGGAEGRSGGAEGKDGGAEGRGEGAEEKDGGAEGRGGGAEEKDGGAEGRGGGAEGRGGGEIKINPRLCLIKCVKGGKKGLSAQCRELRDY